MRDDALKDERSSLHAALPPDSGHTADNKRLTSKTKPNTAQETLKKSLWPDNSVTWVRVVGGFASRKWFVSLTGEIPTRPLPTGGGKPTYKSRTKAEATREERNRGCKEVSIQPEDVLR